MEGCGNHFVVAYRDALADRGPGDAVALCDPHFGVGADGVLVIDQQDGVWGMEVWNADGSIAEMCGNGLRCVVRRLVEDGRWTGRRPIRTGAGLLWAEAKDQRVRLGMGLPRIGPERAFAVGDLLVRGQEASLGNPHFVVVDDALPDLLRWGPQVERDPAFPHRTNVEHVVIEGPRRLRVRVWERGVGETLACGSGATAAAVLVAGPQDEDVIVALPGGELAVRWPGPGHEAELEGPARTVYLGTWLG